MKLILGTDLSKVSFSVIESLCDCEIRDFSEIILAHVIELDHYRAGGSLPYIEEEDKKILDSFAEKIKKMGFNVRTEVRQGNAVEQLNNIAEENNADIIGVTNIGRGLTDNLLGSTAENLASQAKKPVLIEKIEKKEYCRMAEGHTFKNVICAVDFSEPSKKAAKFSSILPGLKELTVLNISTADNNQKAKSQMKKLIKQEGLKAKAVVLTGEPVEEILKYAKENKASCISAGLCGHSGIQRMIWGSVSADLARNSKIPTLIIP